jgi:hypothetical protein
MELEKIFSVPVATRQNLKKAGIGVGKGNKEWQSCTGLRASG